MLDGRGFLKLADLGLAKHAERAWTLVGTPEYVAPEVLRGEGATQAVDWWQMGVLIFEMLSGRLPFEAGDDTELFVAIRRGAYVWPGADGKPIDLPSATVKHLVASLLRQGLPGDAEFQASDEQAGLPRLGSGGRDAREASICCLVVIPMVTWLSPLLLLGCHACCYLFITPVVAWLSPLLLPG